MRSALPSSAPTAWPILASMSSPRSMVVVGDHRAVGNASSRVTSMAESGAHVMRSSQMSVNGAPPICSAIQRLTSVGPAVAGFHRTRWLCPDASTISSCSGTAQLSPPALSSTRTAEAPPAGVPTGRSCRWSLDRFSRREDLPTGWGSDALMTLYGPRRNSRRTKGAVMR